MNEEINELQAKLFSMLIKLDDFCAAEGFQYCLIGGSALGAVRHGGFIPWDDDVDVALMRSDFERFEAAARGKNVSGLLYEPVEEHSFPEAPIGFLYDVSDPNLPLERCPCIDVFALDGIADSAFGRRIQKYASFVYHISVYRRPARNRGGLKAFATKAFIALTPKRMYKFYMKISKKIMTKYPAKQSEYIANIFGMKKFDNEIMPRKYIGTPKRVDFEGRLLPIPQMHEEYLTRLFGDYLSLPHEDERRPHHMNLKWEEDNAANKHNHSNI